MDRIDCRGSFRRQGRSGSWNRRRTPRRNRGHDSRLNHRGDHRLFWWLKGWRTNLRRTLIGASIVKNSDKLEKVVALTATLDGTDLFPSKKVKVFTDTVDLKEIGEFLAEFG